MDEFPNYREYKQVRVDRLVQLNADNRLTDSGQIPSGGYVNQILGEYKTRNI